MKENVMEKQEPHYYQIRASVFWMLIGVMVSFIGAAYFKNDLYEWWLRSGGREEVLFEGMESNLESKEECFLCGNNSQSLGERYKESDGVGIISLNDWYVFEIELKNYGGDGIEDTENRGLSTTFGNTGQLIYCTKSIPARGMASIEITFPDDYSLNSQMIQNNLCQECLDKVGSSLGYSKWKNEEKETVPLCLIDLTTLEIYSLQDWHRGCMIRDYWVEIEPDKESMVVKLFSLLEKG